MPRPDPRPERRTIDRLLMRALHAQWRECVLCGESRTRLSIHHVWKHPRHDVRQNCVMLCGDGTRGCHGLIEAGDRPTRRALAAYLREHRPDTLAFLAKMTGNADRADAWLLRYYYG